MHRAAYRQRVPPRPLPAQAFDFGFSQQRITPNPTSTKVDYVSLVETDR